MWLLLVVCDGCVLVDLIWCGVVVARCVLLFGVVYCYLVLHVRVFFVLCSLFLLLVCVLFVVVGVSVCCVWCCCRGCCCSMSLFDVVCCWLCVVCWCRCLLLVVGCLLLCGVC